MAEALFFVNLKNLLDSYHLHCVDEPLSNEDNAVARNLDTDKTETKIYLINSDEVDIGLLRILFSISQIIARSSLRGYNHRIRFLPIIGYSVSNINFDSAERESYENFKFSLTLCVGNTAYETLREYIRKGRRIPLRYLTKWSLQLLMSLTDLHDQYYCRFNISSENICLTYDQNIDKIVNGTLQSSSINSPAISTPISLHTPTEGSKSRQGSMIGIKSNFLESMFAERKKETQPLSLRDVWLSPMYLLRTISVDVACTTASNPNWPVQFKHLQSYRRLPGVLQGAGYETPNGTGSLFFEYVFVRILISPCTFPYPLPVECCCSDLFD